MPKSRKPTPDDKRAEEITLTPAQEDALDQAWDTITAADIEASLRPTTPAKRKKLPPPPAPKAKPKMKPNPLLPMPMHQATPAQQKRLLAKWQKAFGKIPAWPDWAGPKPHEDKKP